MTDEMPLSGWWPDEAPMCQWLRKDGRNIAQVVKQGPRGWRAFSMVELNQSGTTGKPLSDTVPTQDAAKKYCEEYASTWVPQ
jgi:hypothetical protein